MGDGFVESPVVVRGYCGGNLDGDVIHVLAGEELVGALEAAGCLILAEDRLAEEVHVEADTLAPDLGDRPAELGIGRIHDEVAHHLAQYLACNRNDDAGDHRRQVPADGDGRLHVPGQEGRDLGNQRLQVPGSNGLVLGTDDAVDEAHRELETVRVLQHPGQLSGGGVNREFGSLSQPMANQRHHFLSEVTGADKLGADACYSGHTVLLGGWCFGAGPG